MKKTLALILVVLCCLSLAACGGTSTASTTTSATTTAVAASTTKASETTKAPETTTKAPETTEAPEETTAPEAVTEAEAVCAIGTTYYKTLDDAFTAVKDGETIKVLKDYETTESVYGMSTGNVVLDGQGHKITANIETLGFITVSGFQLTIKDLKVDYTEATKSVANGSLGKAVVSVDDAGSLTLENCEFVSFWGDCLNINDTCTCHVKSGTYKIDTTNDALQSNLFCVNKTATLTVDDGTFSRMGVGSNKRALIRIDSNGAKITINGGTWEASIGRLVYLNSNGASFDIEDGSCRLITINDGTFTFGVDSPAEGFSCDPVIQFGSAKGGDLVINGGTFTVKSDCEMAFFSATKAKTRITINDGIFENGKGTFLAATVATTMEGETVSAQGSFIYIKGGTLTNTAGTFVDASSVVGQLVIEGGTLNTKDATECEAVKAYLSSDSTATVK